MNGDRRMVDSNQMKSSKLIWLFSLLAVIIASTAYLFLQLYWTSSLLVDANRKSFQQEAGNKLEYLEEFFRQRMADVESLSGSRVFETYYHNKALGMSLEYGLAVSIAEMKREVDRFQKNIQDDADSVFAGIGFYDITESRVIAQTETAEKAEWITPDLINKLTHLNHEPTTLVINQNGKVPRIVLYRVVKYQNEVRAYLLFLLNIKVIHERIQLRGLQKPEEFTGLLDSAGGFLAAPPAFIEKNFFDFFGVSRNSLDQLAIHEISGHGNSLLFSGSRIPKTTLYMVMIAPKSKYMGNHSAAGWLMFFFLWMGVILTMSAILIKNFKEKAAMYSAIQEANDNLEHKVKARTAELSLANTELQREIDERTRAEEALRKSEEQLKLAVESGKIGLWDIYLPSGRAVYSGYIAEMVGLEPNEIGSHISSWGQLVHVDDWRSIIKSVTPHLHDLNESYEAQYRLRHKSGKWIWILARGKVIKRDSNGMPLRITGTTLDITDRILSEQALKRAYDELELRVQERTAELAQSNEKLNQEIAERIRTEEALRESERQFRHFVENAGDIIWASDSFGILNYANPGAVKITGYSKEEIVNKSYLEFCPTWYKSTLDEHYREQFRTRTPDSYIETPLTTKQGKTKWLGLNTQLLLEGTKVIGFQAIGRDITDQKKAEERLSWELQLNSALAELYEPLVDPSSSMLDISCKILNTAQKITSSEHGYVAELDPYTKDIISHTLSKDMNTFCKISSGGLARFPIGADGQYPKLWGYSLNTGEAFFTNSPCEHPSYSGLPSEHIPLNNFLAVPVFVADQLVGQIALSNRPEGFTQNELDAVQRLSTYYALAIQRKRSQDALIESELRYRTLFDGASDAIYMIDMEGENKGRIVSANRGAAEMHGYSVEELLTMKIVDLDTPESALRFDERIQCILSGGRINEEATHHKKDGSVFFVEINGVGIELAAHKYCLSIDRNITDRKVAEAGRNLLAKAVEQAGEAIVIMDQKGITEYVNPAYERTTGFAKPEIIDLQENFLQNITDDETLYIQLLEKLQKGEIWKHRILRTRKDASQYYEDVTISAVRNGSGHVSNYVAVGRDITEQVELEKQLRHAQKMEAVGTLSGGIAHDFNNLLQVILGYSDMLMTQKGPQSPDYAELQKIFTASQRGSELVKKLLAFSRKSDSVFSPYNLNKKIDEVKTLLTRIIPRMVRIEVQLAKDLRIIRADPSQMELLIMNLALNANDAMPDGGVLTVQTSNIYLNKEEALLHPGVPPGKFVLLSIADTGCGIDPNTLEHMYEPFYTTKVLGKGTGLGLAMVYGIVKQHDGYITCNSELGLGTRFNVYLPISELSELLPEKTAELPSPGKGSETILLVEDEHLIRDFVTRVLEQSGYKVILAENGRQAIEIFRSEHSGISLVILDLIMPEMGGKDCLVSLLSIKSSAKVLVASGYSEDGISSGKILPGSKGFIGKPYKIKELLHTVRQVLDGHHIVTSTMPEGP